MRKCHDCGTTDLSEWSTSPWCGTCFEKRRKQKRCTHQWFEVRKLSKALRCRRKHTQLSYQGMSFHEDGCICFGKSQDGVLLQCPNCMEMKELWGKE